MDFGTKKLKQVVDDNGSTREIEVNYADGVPKQVFRVEYHKRHRVTTKDEERTVIDNFTEKYDSNNTYIDPRISIERSISGRKAGYYYVVTSWKELRDTIHHLSLIELIERV